MHRLPGFALLLWVFCQSCSSSNYIFDSDSKARQAELRKQRSENTLATIGVSVASIMISAALDADIQIPGNQEFTKLKIINVTADTLYINMLTDVYWDKDNYCDFMDLRIPPDEKFKVLVPRDAIYHLYFSDTPENNDDELLEINTGNIKKIAPSPGMTLPQEKSIYNSDSF